MTDVPMFDIEPIPAPASADPKLSATRRLTLRNAEQLAAGIHPATGERLLGVRTCGECAHCERVVGGRRQFIKCDIHRLGMSRSAASDIRSSWPACTRFEEGA